MQKRYIKPLLAISVTFVLVLFNSLAFGSEFTAILTITNSGHGDRNEYKIYVKDDRYLLIPSLKSQRPPILGNRTTKSVWALYPVRKEYEELNKEQAFFLDPISHFELMPEILNAEKKFVTTETVNEYLCDKYVYVLKPEQKVRNWKLTAIEVWVSKSLDHFIKGIFHQDTDGNIELGKIKEDPIKDAKFQIPQGYKKVEEQ